MFRRMWKEIENGKTNKTRVEETRREREKEIKENTNSRRRKDDSKNGRRKRE